MIFILVVLGLTSAVYWLSEALVKKPKMPKLFDARKEPVLDSAWIAWRERELKKGSEGRTRPVGL